MNSRIGQFAQGRYGLPALWVAGAALALFVGLTVRPGVIGADPAQDAYFVVSHLHFSLSLAAEFVVFAFLYLGLALILPAFRRAFSVIQFALMTVGLALIYAPQYGLAIGSLPRRSEDLPRAFAFWNTVSAVGHAFTLVSLVFFVAAVLSGFRRARTVQP